MAKAINDFFKKYNGCGVDFMNGLEKASLSDISNNDTDYYIEEFAFLANDDGEEYSVFKLRGIDAFFFGNSIITEFLMGVDEHNLNDELKEVPVQFNTRKSKRGRDYTSIVCKC